MSKYILYHNMNMTTNNNKLTRVNAAFTCESGITSMSCSERIGLECTLKSSGSLQLGNSGLKNYLRVSHSYLRLEGAFVLQFPGRPLVFTIVPIPPEGSINTR